MGPQDLGASDTDLHAYLAVSFTSEMMGFLPLL